MTSRKGCLEAPRASPDARSRRLPFSHPIGTLRNIRRCRASSGAGNLECMPVPTAICRTVRDARRTPALAGLSADYIKAQLTAFRQDQRSGSSHARAPQTNMIALAKQLMRDRTNSNLLCLADPRCPSSKLAVSRPPPHSGGQLDATESAPVPAPNLLVTGIVELAEDVERFENRDLRTPYIAYVPTWKSERGADLVATGSSGRTLPCATCHGADLNGLIDVPRNCWPLAGVICFASYTIYGALPAQGAASELMKPSSPT